MSKERQLQQISKFISIKDQKKEYALYYDSARKFIFDQLCEEPFFKSLYQGTDLFGSYADDVKIEKPDEYDCYVLMNFARYGPLEVSKSNIPSAALVNVGEWLNKNKRHPFCQHLKNLTDGKGYLLPRKVNSWFQSVIARQGLSMKQNVFIANQCFQMSYSYSGFAQTFKITGEQSISFSIDLVPSIKFMCHEVWISDRHFVNFDGKNTYWNVAPKPHTNDNKAFKTSFTKMETFMMNHKYQMKNVLRLVKKLILKQNIFFKSYNIKTVFMWMDEEEGEQFWSQSIYVVLEAVLERMIKVFKEINLPCFWDSSENMISKLNLKKSTRIINILENALYTLRVNENVLQVCLNKKEQRKAKNI